MVFDDAYEIEILDHGSRNIEDDNVDVFVYFSDGRKFVATFFTLQNLKSIMTKDEGTGECAGGLYFWASDMIVVQKLDRDTIHKAVADLVKTGEFAKAFSGPYPLDAL
jgi:hypothetical protein